MEFIIVTGMSGAGKSRAVDALEDIGYYCVDNLPPVLLAQFAQLLSDSVHSANKVALVVDARGTDLLEDFEQGLRNMQSQGISYRIVFLDCDDPVLVQRYKETRRRHPLTEVGDISVKQAIARERKLLRNIRSAAHYHIDSTNLTSAQIREQVVQLFSDSPETEMTVQCMSFGFKYGTPHEADVTLDVRCFPNPFYVDNLKNRTGLEKEVQDFVLGFDQSKEFEKRLYDLIDYMLPLYRNEGKCQLIIAFGCTGGKHRSVTFCEQLAAHLQQSGTRVVVNHRDIDKR